MSPSDTQSPGSGTSGRRHGVAGPAARLSRRAMRAAVRQAARTPGHSPTDGGPGPDRRRGRGRDRGHAARRVVVEVTIQLEVDVRVGDVSVDDAERCGRTHLSHPRGGRGPARPSPGRRARGPSMLPRRRRQHPAQKSRRGDRSRHRAPRPAVGRWCGARRTRRRRRRWCRVRRRLQRDVENGLLVAQPRRPQVPQGALDDVHHALDPQARPVGYLALRDVIATWIV